MENTQPGSSQINLFKRFNGSRGSRGRSHAAGSSQTVNDMLRLDHRKPASSRGLYFKSLINCDKTMSLNIEQDSKIRYR